MKPNEWIGPMTLVASFGVLASGQTPTPPGATNQNRALAPDPIRVTVDLSALSTMQTLVGYRRTNQPPWPNGNCLTLSTKTNATSGLPPGEWRLVNLHAENFHELVKRQRLKSIELGLLSHHRCFVLDVRVSHDWLLIRPCSACWSLERRLAMKIQYPELFRRNPQAEALVGTSWVLMNRNDPDGLLARMLPGDRIDYGDFELTCRAASGNICGRRLWELEEMRPVSWLAVYEVRSTNAYTGVGLTLTQEKDRMILVPNSRLKRDATSVGSEQYQTAAQAVYHLQQKRRK